MSSLQRSARDCRWTALMPLVVALGCGGLACGGRASGGPPLDSGTALDTATAPDTGTAGDTGALDTATAGDTGVLDTATAPDTGTAGDTGALDTATAPDTGTAGDTGALDTATALDTGSQDTRPPADGASSCHANLVGGQDTGFDSCDDGTIRRRAVITCPGARATTTGCRSDSDCAMGSICQCSGAEAFDGICIPATCTTGSSCPAGLDCISTVRSEGPNTCSPHGPMSFACQTTDDTCYTDADCGDTSLMPRECRLVGDHRVCGCKLI